MFYTLDFRSLSTLLSPSLLNYLFSKIHGSHPCVLLDLTVQILVGLDQVLEILGEV
jgi:hypothetical protein